MCTADGYLGWCRHRTEKRGPRALFAVFQILLMLTLVDAAHFAWPISCELRTQTWEVSVGERWRGPSVPALGVSGYVEPRRAQPTTPVHAACHRPGPHLHVRWLWLLRGPCLLGERPGCPDYQSLNTVKVGESTRTRVLIGEGGHSRETQELGFGV